MSEINTEKKILEAAREVFTTKGLDGARMQDIADKAGINKALLHYYFRSKEMLFQKIFLEKGRDLVTVLEYTVSTSVSVREKVVMLIDLEFEKLEQEPLMPLFVINEINRTPEKVLQVPEIKECKIHLRKLAEQVEAEKRKGKIHKDVHFQDIVTDIMSMMHFPRIAKNLLAEVLYDGDKENYDRALLRRKEHIKELVLRSLDP